MKEDIYTIVDYPEYNKETGKFKAKSPLAAAKKVFTKLEKNFDLNNNNSEKQYIEFTIRNISNNKFYTYMGTKILLHSAITINQGGKKRKIYYKHLINRKPRNLNINTLDFLIKNYNKVYNRNNQNSY